MDMAFELTAGDRSINLSLLELDLHEIYQAILDLECENS